MARGSVDMWFDCVVFTSMVSDRVGQKAVYEYLSTSGTKSIVKAVADTPGLGLSNVNASAASDWSPRFGVEEVAAYGYYGAVVPVLVVTIGA